jgi:histidinol-phosphate/aromatic aminotransferase/cobyric acid decarboxylase-like protein
MAIHHVLTVFPHQNDLINFEELRRQAEECEGAQGASSSGSKVSAYIPTTSLEKIGKSGCSVSSVLKLDWNEGVVAPPRSVQQALISVTLRDQGHRLKWYPELGGGKTLLRLLAKYSHAVEENLLVTNGTFSEMCGFFRTICSLFV